LQPDTAKGLKVDPQNLEQNIAGGVSLIKELMSNPKIGNDPYKVLIGYNTCADTRNKYFDSGDLTVLPAETLDYMEAASNHFGGQLPSPMMAPVETAEASGAPSTDASTVGSTDDTISSQEANPVSATIMGGFGAGAGAALGATAAAWEAKKDAAEKGKEVIDLLKNKGAGAVDDVDGLTPGEKYARKTGYGEGTGTVKNVVDRQKLQSPNSKIAKRVYEHNKAVQSLSAAEARAAEEASLAAKAAQAAEETSPLWKYARHLASLPVKGALTGAGIVGGAADVYNRVKDKHYGEAALSAVGNAAGAAAPWLGGAVAAPLATIGGIAAPLYLGASDRLRHLEKHPEDYRLQEDEYDAMGNRQR